MEHSSLAGLPKVQLWGVRCASYVIAKKPVCQLYSETCFVFVVVVLCKKLKVTWFYNWRNRWKNVIFFLQLHSNLKLAHYMNTTRVCQKSVHTEHISSTCLKVSSGNRWEELSFAATPQKNSSTLCKGEDEARWSTLIRGSLGVVAWATDVTPRQN